MFCRLNLLARVLPLSLALAGCLLCISCGQYATPGRGADLKAIANVNLMTDTSINATLAKKPLATLPCGIAAVRIQATGYSNGLGSTYGEGNYCVVTTRDIESETAMNGISTMPMVLGVAPVNRLVLPAKLNSDLELRQAAAALHADMLLIYTIDTTFEVEDHLAPLTVLTLGLAPNMTAQIVTTASAVLMDTRNGYVYGFAEDTEHGIQLTNGWMTQEAVNDARKRTEARAFEGLVKNLKVTWTGVVKNMGQSAPTAMKPAAIEPSTSDMATQETRPVVAAPAPQGIGYETAVGLR